MIGLLVYRGNIQGRVRISFSAFAGASFAQDEVTGGLSFVGRDALSN